MKPISQEAAERLKELTRRQLEGCRVPSQNSKGEEIFLYTPDGMASYNALWTRDFAYMAEYAGDLMPTKDLYDNVNALWEGIRPEDGWVPDRVDSAGVPVYAAGPADAPCGLPNLDNGPFLAMAACLLGERLEKRDRSAFWGKYAPALYRGLCCLPKDKRGLIWNDPEAPHSPYGFTDCIRKTGSLCMESLLLWRAAKMLADALEEAGLLGDIADGCRRMQTGVEENLMPVFWEQDAGMLLAATETCRQVDVWASCYACAIGFPLSCTEHRRIANWLYANRAGILEHGHLRHTAPGKFWEACLIPVSEGKYQNGAFWATASGWLIAAVNTFYPDFAGETFAEALCFFETDNIYECINGDYRQLKNYVVSATNLYGVLKDVSAA